MFTYGPVRPRHVLLLPSACACGEREREKGRKNLGKSDAATFVPSRPRGEERKGEGGQKWKKTEEEEAGGKPSEEEEEEETVNPGVEGGATINYLFPFLFLFPISTIVAFLSFPLFPFSWSQRNRRLCATNDDFPVFFVSFFFEVPRMINNCLLSSLLHLS